MKISPMDIQRQTFGVRLRGFDPDEVRAFLAVVAEEMAALQRDKDEIEQQLRHLEQIVGEHRERETILKNTLLTAQKAAEDIRESARRRPSTVVKQAELQGDRLLELAQAPRPRGRARHPRAARAPHRPAHRHPRRSSPASRTCSTCRRRPSSRTTCAS